MDIRDLFEDILALLLSITGSEYGFIGEIKCEASGVPYLKTYAITNIAWNEETQRFYAESAPTGLEFRNLETLFGYTIKTGKVMISNDPMNDPRSGGLPDGHPDLNAYLGLPLYGNSGKMVGMAGISNRLGGYQQATVDYLDPFIKTMGSIIESYMNTQAVHEQRQQLETLNRRLEQQAETDYLTGLGNRAYFDKRLAQEFLHAQKTQGSFTILILDVDNFKQVNDTYGHLVGDVLLQHLAGLLQKALGQDAIITRFGGDEFALILERSQFKARAVEKVEALLSSVRSHEFTIEGHAICVSISVGGSFYPDSGRAVRALMKVADQALYQAKQGGKDQLSFC